jgi:hypothetical protein
MLNSSYRATSTILDAVKRNEPFFSVDTYHTNYNFSLSFIVDLILL